MASNRDRTFMWDYFVDFCTAQGVSTDDRDFDAWCDEQIDAAIDEGIYG